MRPREKPAKFQKMFEEYKLADVTKNKTLILRHGGDIAGILLLN